MPASNNENAGENTDGTAYWIRHRGLGTPNPLNIPFRGANCSPVRLRVAASLSLESLALLAVLAVVGAGGFAALGRSQSASIAGDAAETRESAANSVHGLAPLSVQAGLVSVAADAAGDAARIEHVTEGLGVAGSRPVRVFPGRAAFSLVDRLPARGSDEWRAYVATVRAGLAPGVGQGYAVLPTAERLHASLGRGLIEAHPSGLLAAVDDPHLSPRHSQALAAYTTWLEDLVNEALGSGDPLLRRNGFARSSRGGEVRVNTAARSTRDDRWHVDGGFVRAALTLEGEGTDFLPVVPGIRTEDWQRTWYLRAESEARLRAQGFHAVRARRGDIVLFRGQADQLATEARQVPGWEPAIHRSPLGAAQDRAFVIVSLE